VQEEPRATFRLVDENSSARTQTASSRRDFKLGALAQARYDSSIGNDPRGDTPRYRWIRDQLVKLIVVRRLNSGDAFESEGKLATRFGVSLGTVRKAVDALVARGVLVRHQGKGTFVAGRDPHAPFNLSHIVGDDGRKEIPVFSRLVKLRERAAGERERELLRIAHSVGVIEMSRTRTFSDGASMLEHVLLPSDLFPDFRSCLGRQRPVLLYEFYEEAFGVRIMSFDDKVRAIAASSQDARWIGCNTGDPLLQVERIAFGYDSRPVELRTTRCESRSRHFHVGQTNTL
jgi:GntR family transcriptional regulator